MLKVIDRRLSGKNKSLPNRERFLRRYKGQIKEAIADAVRERGIRDLEQAKDVTIPRKDVSEPVFRHGPGGVRRAVHPGNQEYVKGDRIARPDGGGGGRGGSASDSGEGEDDFVFTLSREEFMQYFFEDLELPNLAKTILQALPDSRPQRAGFASEGTPSNIDIARSLKGAIGRRIALAAAPAREVRRLEIELARMRADPADHRVEITALEEELHHLRWRVLRIPYIDPFDLRYINRVRQPQPASQAVMFCIMDVSGSMTEERKDIAKRFFILLYLFLTRNYEKTEVVFIRHHTQADEVGEEEFFRSRETGGTVVSSALRLMTDIVRARFPTEQWNIYAAQASDGDNWNDDSAVSRQLLGEKILPLVRHFAYVQVVDEEQNLWTEYAALEGAHPNFAMRKIARAADIYPVFHELFRKQTHA